MKQSDFPAPLTTLIAQNAAATDITTIPATQSRTGDGTASLALGFPPETFIARSAGGVPPRGQDMNGLLNLISKILRAYQAGCCGLYNSGFAQAIGGYPAGAVVSGSSPGTFWVSTADDNVTTPGSDGATWQNLFTGYLPLSGGTVSWLNVAGPLTAEGFDGITAQAVPSNPQTGDYINYPSFYSKAQGRGGQFIFGLQEHVGSTFTGLLSLQFNDGSWRYVGWGQNQRINDSQFGPVAYTSDLSGYVTNATYNNGLSAYVTSATYGSDFATSDSRVINLAFGHRIQAFQTSVGNGSSSGSWVTFPVAFSGIPFFFQANSCGNADGATDTDYFCHDATATGMYVRPRNFSGLANIIVIGPK
nr:phage tail protein [uncultured Acetobacter sp.]